ncbi:MAG: phosphoenolpyruvate carboxykinase, partial [candidate division NC10 bacterium]|nr:phosphoenolpyruvate carboxykinase [candidate division NC10 bacterium]
MTENATARRWVSEVAALCRPADVVWCDGSAAERERFQEEAVKRGDVIPLNQRVLPGCTLHRSDPTDVARTEHLTFICCREEADAGPTNNWMSPAKAYDRLSKILAGSMAGRMMYVIPFLLGPPGSPFGKVGIQVTDSLYVVLNMGIMTRMGKIALEQLGGSA